MNVKYTTVVLVVVLSGIVAFVAALVAAYLLAPGADEAIPTDGWWGAGDPTPDPTEITKINIHFNDESLQDLKSRLSQTRYFDSLIGTHWEYGLNPAYMRTLIEHWRNNYDWRKQEQILNSYDQFTTKIEGIKVHFLHYKPSVKPGQKLISIMLIHGWPGSFYEFYKLIPKLAKQASDSELAIEVVCPSIQGYGFSEAPHRPGFDPIAAARVFSKLMARLGMTSYYVQGGDWGSIIARYMAAQVDDRLASIKKKGGGGGNLNAECNTLQKNKMESIVLPQEGRFKNTYIALCRVCYHHSTAMWNFIH